MSEANDDDQGGWVMRWVFRPLGWVLRLFGYGRDAR